MDGDLKSCETSKYMKRSTPKLTRLKDSAASWTHMELDLTFNDYIDFIYS